MQALESKVEQCLKILSQEKSSIYPPQNPSDIQELMVNLEQYINNDSLDELDVL